MSRSKKAKAEAAQSVRQAELREKETERERARNEAASRRQDRAGRRRVDEETGEETPKASNSAKTSPPPSSQPGSPHANGSPEKVSHKKGAGKKTKKLGNNQYTNKTKESAASSPHGRKRNGAGISSGEENNTNGDSQHMTNGASKASPDHTSVPKPKLGRGKKALNGNGGKHEDPAELTLPNMKRRMDAMAAFISRAQLEIAGGDRRPSGGSGDASLAGGAVQPPTSHADDGGGGVGKQFEELSAMEMADVVSRSINSWHQRFAHLV